MTSTRQLAAPENPRRIPIPRLCTLALAPLLLLGCATEQTPDPQLEQEARAITQQFVGTLLPTLQQALQNGGPVNAIEVCSVQAPAIARNLAQSSGWDVTRVSLKARNSNSATPDSWEREILNEFDRRQQAGEAGPNINAAAIVDGNYRFMQAQPAMPLCLTCHGTEISAEVSSALRQHYPNDMATGYSAGQIRGAISLQKTLD